MVLCIRENIIRFNSKQKSLQNYITPTSRGVKERDKSETQNHVLVQELCIISVCTSEYHLNGQIVH